MATVVDIGPKKTPNQERRLKALCVDPELILSMLGGWKSCDALYLPKFKDGALPDDAEIISVHADELQRRFIMLVASATYDPVPIGQEAERISLNGTSPILCDYDAVDLRQIPGLAVRKLSPKPGGLFLCTFAKDSHNANDIKNEVEQIAKRFRNSVFVSMSSDTDLRQLDPEEMRRAGWVRAEEKDQSGNGNHFTPAQIPGLTTWIENGVDMFTGEPRKKPDSCLFSRALSADEQRKVEKYWARRIADDEPTSVPEPTEGDALMEFFKG